MSIRRNMTHVVVANAGSDQEIVVSAHTCRRVAEQNCRPKLGEVVVALDEQYRDGRTARTWFSGYCVVGRRCPTAKRKALCGEARERSIDEHKHRAGA